MNVICDPASLGPAEKAVPIPVQDALRAGRPQDLRQLTGSLWRVRGVVEHGDARGRTLGFPTANMHLSEDFLAFGIYAVRVGIERGDRIASWHDGVANFGIRPMYRTIWPLLEAHLFDFSGDLYGKTLTVELVAWLRPEAKFPNLGALIGQIQKDAQQARAVLKNTALRASA